MIYSLRGTAKRLKPPFVAIDVAGVGYMVAVPHPLWEQTVNGSDCALITYTYIREDRLELFGFATDNDRTFFAELIGLTGIGPKIALELCSIPKHLLSQAIGLNDTRTLTQIRGIGAKTAEKLLLDLKNLQEKHPEIWSEQGTATQSNVAAFDADALAALLSLGYDQRAALEALRALPTNITKTEDRVTAILRSSSGKRKTPAAKSN